MLRVEKICDNDVRKDLMTPQGRDNILFMCTYCSFSKKEKFALYKITNDVISLYLCKSHFEIFRKNIYVS